MRPIRNSGLTILAGIIILASCSDEKEMLVSTGTATDILLTGALVTGTIVDLGDGASQHGHCYSTSPNPNISAQKTELGTPVPGNYTSTITGINPDTKYYVRAYISRGKEVAYGNEINFTTASATLPELITSEVTGITGTQAVGGGNVTNQGGTPVTARGVCWSTATITALTSTRTVDGNGVGIFTSEISGLSPGVNYYVRAYATNSGGTKLGNEVTFTATPESVVPSVTTTQATSVTSVSAVSGGEVTSDGGTAILARGVCWRPNEPNPNIQQHSKTIDGNQIGPFTSDLSPLSPGTTYYYRAYATNSVGTAYGMEYNFTTPATLPIISTIPATGITQNTANSGGDITSSGGASITAKGVCWNTSPNPTTGNFTTSDGIGTGAYISNMSSLSANTNYWVKAYATNIAGTGYGNEITFATLAVITTSDPTGVTNTSAVCGGAISAGGGANITARGVCWSTAPNPTTANSYTNDATGTGSFVSTLTELTSNTTYYARAYATNSGGTSYGNQVSFMTLPSVTGNTIYSITTTSAVIESTIDPGGGENITARGVCWKLTQNPTISDSKTDDGVGTGSFTSFPTGLSYNMNYYFRTYATNSSGTTYGPQLALRTPNNVLGPSGYWYNIVKIGNQYWFVENLKTNKYRNGDNIATTMTVSDDISDEPNPKYQWSYNDNEADVPIYGRLYTWYAVTDPRGVCPTGWHVPTDQDWTTLEIYLQNNGFNYDGTIDTDNDRITNNNTAKALAGTSLWTSSPTAGAVGNTDYPDYRNRSSFNALPGGYRYPHGDFQNINQSGYWWSSTEYSADNGLDRVMVFYSRSLNRYDYHSKKMGYSVRCIKD